MNLRDKSGFVLVHVAIGFVIAFIFSAGIYQLFTTQQRYWAEKEAQETQQETHVEERRSSSSAKAYHGLQLKVFDYTMPEFVNNPEALKDACKTVREDIIYSGESEVMIRLADGLVMLIIPYPADSVSCTFRVDFTIRYEE